MPESEKVTTAAPAKASPKRQKVIGMIATLAGLVAALVGLVGVLSNEVDMLYVLLFAGGMLVSVLGLRRLRKARAS